MYCFESLLPAPIMITNWKEDLSTSRYVCIRVYVLFRFYANEWHVVAELCWALMPWAHLKSDALCKSMQMNVDHKALSWSNFKDKIYISGRQSVILCVFCDAHSYAGDWCWCVAIIASDDAQEKNDKMHQPDSKAAKASCVSFLLIRFRF